MSTVGSVTYNTVTCPTCGATLSLGYQALAPEYLIANAQCPYCGTVVGHNVVSITPLAGPTIAPWSTEVQQTTSSIDVGSILNLMITMMIVVMMMEMMGDML